MSSKYQVMIETDHDTFIRDITTAFPVETQELVLKLHQRLMDAGFKFEATSRRFSSTGYFLLYAPKRKKIEDIWVIKIMPDDCVIRFDSKNASQYADVIERFPSFLLDIITNGDGCIYNPAPEKCHIESNGQKFTIDGMEYTKCNSKCCAACDFWIPLTGLTSEKSQAIEKWVALELAYLT